jgi:hypothetical protein
MCKALSVVRFMQHHSVDHEKKINLMQIHLYEAQILQIHIARPEFVKNINERMDIYYIQI